MILRHSDVTVKQGWPGVYLYIEGIVIVQEIDFEFCVAYDPWLQKSDSHFVWVCVCVHSATGQKMVVPIRFS